MNGGEEEGGRAATHMRESLSLTLMILIFLPIASHTFLPVSLSSMPLFPKGSTEMQCEAPVN